MKKIASFKQHVISLSMIDKAMKKVIKGIKITI